MDGARLELGTCMSARRPDSASTPDSSLLDEREVLCPTTRGLLASAEPIDKDIDAFAVLQPHGATRDAFAKHVVAHQAVFLDHFTSRIVERRATMVHQRHLRCILQEESWRVKAESPYLEL